jgi:hypothetical protein
MDDNHTFQDCEENNMGSIIMGVMYAATIEAMEVMWEQSHPIPRQPKHTLSLSGLDWVHHVLAGHVERPMDMFRMTSEQFFKLRDMLLDRKIMKRSQNMHPDKMLAIFLYGAGHGARNREMQERFQRSARTISKWYIQVSQWIKELQYDHIVLPDDSIPIPSKIRNNREKYPYFKVRHTPTPPSFSLINHVSSIMKTSACLAVECYWGN